MANPAEAESITFTAKDGTHLHGWFIPTAFGRPKNAVATVVIHVHGNAGNMLPFMLLITVFWRIGGHHKKGY